MAIEELGAADLNSWKPVKPSSSPSATILSEKMILGLPWLVFDLQISKLPPLEGHIFCFEKNIFETWALLTRFDLSISSAKNQAWFPRATLICTMKSTNYYPKVDTQTTGLAWIESSLYSSAKWQKLRPRLSKFRRVGGFPFRVYF